MSSYATRWRRLGARTILTRAVAIQGELIDQLARVVGGGSHRSHARSVFARERLGHGTEHLVANRLGQQHFEHRLGVGLVNVVLDDTAAAVSVFRTYITSGQRQQDERAGLVAQRRNELGVEENDLLHLVLQEEGDGFVGDLVDLGQIDGAVEVVYGAPDLPGTALEVVLGLATDDQQLVLHAAAVLRRQIVLRLADDVGVVAAAQPLVGTDDHDQALLHVALLEERMIDRSTRERAQQLDQLAAVGTAGHETILRAAQLGGGDHLHGSRDLLGVLDRADPCVEFFDVLGQRSSLSA